MSKFTPCKLKLKERNTEDIRLTYIYFSSKYIDKEPIHICMYTLCTVQIAITLHLNSTVHSEELYLPAQYSHLNKYYLENLLWHCLKNK